jgi:hypothetical protein
MSDLKLTRRALLSGAAALGISSALPEVSAASVRAAAKPGSQQTLAPDQDEWMN